MTRLRVYAKARPLRSSYCSPPNRFAGFVGDMDEKSKGNNQKGIKNMKRSFVNKLLVLAMAALMLLGVLPLGALADELEGGEALAAPVAEQTAEPTSVTVTIRSQMEGIYLHGFAPAVTVSSDLAESYGYTDGVTDGVSALDALVKAHELFLGTELTTGTAKDYLAVNSSGSVTTIFGVETYNNGFLLNGGYPNDGTEASWGGYNGTTVSTQKLATGDVVDFFVYQDDYLYSDKFTWINMPAAVFPGQEFEVTVTGSSPAYGYMYKTPEEFKASGTAVSEAKLVWINATTGEANPVGDEYGYDVTTEYSGKATITAPSEAGSYLLAAATGGTGYYDTKVIMNPSTITVSDAATTSITIEYAGKNFMDGNLILVKNGNTLPFRAVDQLGRVVPVTWSLANPNSITWGSFDTETGVLRVSGAGAMTEKSFTLWAKCTDGESINTEETFKIYGFGFETNSVNPEVSLSADGQTETTITLRGGLAGKNKWSTPGQYVTTVSQTVPAGNGDSATYNCLRPGSYTVMLELEGDASMVATSTVKIKGVAVETADGVRKQTTLTIDRSAIEPTVQLKAYLELGRKVASWSSANESIATVDNNGKVTARGVGSVIITAEDDKGNKGGIMINVEGVNGADLAAAMQVDALIDDIGTVTLESGAKIETARMAYDALTDAQKTLVTNHATLTAAENAYDVLCYEAIYNTTGGYIAALGTPGVGSVGGEWMVIGLGRSGRSVPEGYYTAAMQHVLENADENGRVNANQATDNARLILALTAIGKDVTNVAGVDLLAALNEMDYISKQGINGPIWALIALDSHAYPEQGDATRAALCKAILDKQLEDGGWMVYGGTADPDMTAMALQALAPYYNKDDTALDAAVNKALTLLSERQDADGDYGSGESCAQVITALTALGIDPVSDARFVKNGKNVIDALCAYAVDGGGFKHTSGGALNGMATEQGYYALASYFRFKGGKTSLYDMTDVTIATTNAVDDVEELIDAIGDPEAVTADSKTAIEAARKVYDALDDAQKASVSNVSTLTAAETAYAAIAAQIAAVETAIEAIGDVNAQSKPAIEAAQAAYDALPEASRRHVANRAKLTAATAMLPLVEQAAEVEALIDAIGDPETVTADSKSAIEAARKAYDALGDEAKALVTNYAKLTAAERRLAALDPQGGTKVIGTGSTRLVLDGVTYMVDAEAASLMKRIADLRDAGGMNDEGILDAYRTYDNMSRELKAQVFNFADLQALCTALGVRGHRDGMSGIKAEGLPWYVGLEVTAITSGADYDTVAGSIGHNELLALWNIAFVNRLTGETFTPYENVTLRMDVPAYDAALEQFRMARYADGRVAYSDCTVSGGELSWTVLDGGVYGFLGGMAAAEATLEHEEETETAEPEMPEETPVPTAEPAAAEPALRESESPVWLWIVVGAAGVALLIVAIVLKKRDRERQRAAKH